MLLISVSIYGCSAVPSRNECKQCSISAPVIEEQGLWRSKNPPSHNKRAGHPTEGYVAVRASEDSIIRYYLLLDPFSINKNTALVLVLSSTTSLFQTHKHLINTHTLFQTHKYLINTHTVSDVYNKE